MLGPICNRKGQYLAIIKYQNGIIFKPIWKKVKYVYSTTAYVRSCILPNQQLVPFLDKSIFLPCPIQFNVSMLDSATIYFLVQCCYCKATPLFWDLVMWFLRSECQWIDPCHQEADRETLILPVHMLRKTVGGSDVKRWKNILLTSQKKTFHSFKTPFICWHEWPASVGSMTKIIG